VNSWNSILHNKWLTVNYFKGFENVYQPAVYGLMHPKSGVDLYGNFLRNFNDLINTIDKIGGDKFVIKHIGGGKGRSVYIINGIKTEGSHTALELIDGNVIRADGFDNILNVEEGKLQGYLIQQKIDAHKELDKISSGGL